VSSRSVLNAASGGDQRTLLVALRDHLAPLIDDPSLHPRDLNSLSFRMLEILRDLDGLDRPAWARKKRRTGLGR
jgi:hypothetical protein